jgi:hypothetical protein
VTGNTFRAEVSAGAPVREMNILLPRLRAVAGSFLHIVCLSAALVLFFGWLIFSESRRLAIRGSEPGSDCTSIGKGVLNCSTKGPSSDQPTLTDSAEGDCASLGRGGRGCSNVRDRGSP